MFVSQESVTRLKLGSILTVTLVSLCMNAPEKLCALALFCWGTMFTLTSCPIVFLINMEAEQKYGRDGDFQNVRILSLPSGQNRRKSSL